MSDFAKELDSVLAFARRWLGREPTEEEVRKLIDWLQQEVNASNVSQNPIDAGLAAATAVIAEGREAADHAMRAALSAAVSAERQVEQKVVSGPVPTGPPSLESQVQKAQNAFLGALPEDDGPDPSSDNPLARIPELVGYIAEIVSAEVTKQLTVKLVEFDAKADVKLTETSNAAVAICDKLSADIREQMARELAQNARKKVGRKTR